MRAIVAAVALASLGGLAACAASPVGTPGSRLSGGASDGTVLRRATILTHDLDASIAFYEAIGFEQWYIGEAGTVSSHGLPVGGVAEGDPSRLVIMRGKDPYLGMIGLLQYGEPREAPQPGTLHHGDAIMMIETTDLAARAAALSAAGYIVHQQIETSHIESVGDEWDASFFFVFDPDGNLVELNERHN